MNNRLLIYLVVSLTFFSIHVSAQKIQKVIGEFTYYAEEYETLRQAKNKALEGAKLKALSKVFGTLISQDTYFEERANNGKESSSFTQLTSSEVKGEWIEDIKEPIFKIDFHDDMLIVKCEVAGNAREISNESIEFEALVLKNGTGKQHESVKFKNGDQFYLHFRSPVDGYVAVYLIDEKPTAYCLLPYQSNRTGQQTVKSGENYVFFDAGKKLVNNSIDELRLTCDNDIEHYKIYVLFSPIPFTKAIDNYTSEDQPRQLAYEEFSKWLGKIRRKDPKMGMKVFRIDVSK